MRGVSFEVSHRCVRWNACTLLNEHFLDNGMTMETGDVEMSCGIIQKSSIVDTGTGRGSS